MHARKFKQVDVFTAIPYAGNPVAVALEAEGLSDEQMQRFAAWTNLSETTFVLPPTQPGADYRLRIFTPRSEIPFAGHPALGSAHAVLEAGIVRPANGCMVQECAAGLLPLRINETGETRTLFVQVPRPKLTVVDAATSEEIERALGAGLAQDAAPVRVDVGATWLVALLEDEEAVHALQPDLPAVTELGRAQRTSGVIAFALTGREEYQVYLRAFAPLENVPEDPVCGSGNASAGAFLHHYGKLGITGREYTANQGWEVGRRGVIRISVAEDGGVEIGGAAVTCVDGTVLL